jgi:hypothetical protein
VAVDPGQVTEQQDVGGDAGGASDRSTESGGFSLGRAIRGLLGYGGDPQPSEADAEPTTEDAPATPAPGTPATITTTQADIDRLVQSRSDQLLLKQQREWAKGRADEGDLAPIRTLAEKGDPWAKQELRRNGDTWALGEIAAKELEAQEQAANDPIPHVATMYDAAVLHTVLGALPEDEERRIVGDGITGLDGRQRAVAQAIEAIKKTAHAAGVEAGLEKARKNPAIVKQALLSIRGEHEEPDNVPAVGAGRTASPDDAIRAAVFGRR